MQVFKLTGLRETGFFETPKPERAGEHDVLIRVATVGVCGSDIHYYTTGRIGSQVVDFPFAVGHEVAGLVEEVGEAVTRVRPGDRVAVDPAMPCNHCDQCLAGRQHTCRNLVFLGCPGQAEGCLADYIVMPENCCFPVGHRLSLTGAALSEPLAIGVYAVRLAGRLAGQRIGILGMGPIGHSVMDPARKAGVKAVYATDRIDERVNRARTRGADWAGHPDRVDVVREIEQREPLLLDTVFECCGKQEALDQAVDLLKPGGRLMLIGIPEVDRVSFVIDKLRRKEICVQNVRRQVDCVEEALDLIADEQRFEDIVTHRFPFSRSEEAFNLVADYRDGVLKAMIDFLPGEEL